MDTDNEITRAGISIRNEDGSLDRELLRSIIYKKYPMEDLKQQLITFHEENVDPYVLNDAGKSTAKISIHFFREEQYRAKNARSLYSPDDLLSSDELLQKAYEKIDKKPNYYKPEYGDDRNFINFITNDANFCSKVAIFSPNLARKIYERWCPVPHANIHDASAGWGNRCLAAISSKYGYNYFGTDPNTALHEKYKQQADFVRETLQINPEVDIRCQGSEVFVPEWEGKMDLSFTSPPYFATEKYSDDDMQSAKQFGNYESWRDDFMRPTIKNVYKYLKPGAYYLLNLKNLTSAFGNFPAFNDWCVVAQEEGFILEDIVPMFYQSTRQFGTSSKTGKKREVKFNGDKEPVAVLRKPTKDDNMEEYKIKYVRPNTIDGSWFSSKGRKKSVKVKNKSY